MGIILLTSIITVVSTILISHQKSGLNKEQRANLKKIEYVYQTLNKDYYKKQSSDKLTQSAINGMVKELKDPYSEYMTAEETKQFNEGVSGDFVGIGAEMQKKNEQISVTSPMKDSPAEKAGIQPKDVQYLNAHGTSTAVGDLNEVKAIKNTFGEAAKHLKVSSTKSMTGHLLGATGGIEAIFSALSIKDSKVAPTIHAVTPDPECDLDIVPNEAQDLDITYAMSNSLGFGGHNAVLVFKKFEA